MIALAPRYHFTSSAAVAVLFLLSAVAPILIVAGMRGRLARYQINIGFAVLAAILVMLAPALFRLGKSPNAPVYWGVWCSFLFGQSLVLSLLAMKEREPNSFACGTTSQLDDDGGSGRSDSA